MSRQLLILRHGEAGSGPVDFERQLTGKGIEDTHQAGQWLAARSLLPELVLCSPAVRTRQTLQSAVAGMALEPASQFPESLYNADTQTLAELIHQQQQIQRLLLIGHNPGLSIIASTLVGRSLALSPASLLLLEFEGDWSSLGQALVQLADRFH
ncbi:MAG: histidine phosphatase family protein [Chromatiales bacterium]|jgi:phosphohistidine phosphatase